MENNEELVRLNKYLTSMGVCSRREADKLIKSGRVKVNGKVVQLGGKISSSDKVTVNNQVIKKDEERIYIALNKPIGITCTTEKRVQGNIVDFVKKRKKIDKRIFPIGRLDKPSEGLIFLTNDGDIVNKILRASNNHEKEYIVTVDKEISKGFLNKMGNGIPILDTVTKKCKISKINNFTFNIVLTEGLNRQIRRMCEYLGYEVVKLKRVRIMNVNLDNLKSGNWRYLTKKEMKQIERLISGSKNEVKK